MIEPVGPHQTVLRIRHPADTTLECPNHVGGQDVLELGQFARLDALSILNYYYCPQMVQVTQQLPLIVGAHEPAIIQVVAPIEANTEQRRRARRLL